MTVDLLKEPVRIDVKAGPDGSPIWIGEGVSERAGTLLDAQRVGARRFVVSSPVIWRFHGEHISRALGGSAARTPSRERDGDPARTPSRERDGDPVAAPALRRVEPILVPDGERYKTLQSVARIYEALIRAEADRGSAIVALGGGVIGDTAGFAAATFLRGIALAHVPTTLLAQVDSAIGGKVGINHPLGKNLIGAFYQPAAVLIDPLLLGTLPRREFRSGLYEVVKYGMIASRDLFDRVARDTKAIFDRDPAVLLPAIIESCRIKADVVSRDERESGLRRILNFGHTVGHALEAVTRYRRYRHGEAIAFGMLAAADLAVARGALAERERQALARLITRLGPLPPVGDLATGEVLEAIRRDKKVVNGKLHFVIAIQIGATMTIDDVTEEELKAALERLGLKR